MTPARFALSDAFGLFLHGSDQDAFAHIDPLQQKKRDAIPKPKPKRIKRADVGGVSVIVELPDHNEVTGKNTWVGRTSTNHRNAVAIDAGKLMASALDQSELKARWLEFCYDPYFEIGSDWQRRRFEQIIFPGVCMMWAFWPHKRARPTLRQLPRYLALIEQCIYSYSRYVRSGIPAVRTTATAKAEAMGYGTRINNEIRGAYKASNWQRDWAPLDADLFRMLEELDEKAMAPVVVAFMRQVDRRRAEAEANRQVS